MNTGENITKISTGEIVLPDSAFCKALNQAVLLLLEILPKPDNLKDQLPEFYIGDQNPIILSRMIRASPESLNDYNKCVDLMRYNPNLCFYLDDQPLSLVSFFNLFEAHCEFEKISEKISRLLADENIIEFSVEIKKRSYLRMIKVVFENISLEGLSLIIDKDDIETIESLENLIANFPGVFRNQVYELFLGFKNQSTGDVISQWIDGLHFQLRKIHESHTAETTLENTAE